MQRHEIPTAQYAACTTLDEVRQELPRFAVPVVVKADGLAAGKGVVICETHLQAEHAAAVSYQHVPILADDVVIGPLGVEIGDRSPGALGL